MPGLIFAPPLIGFIAALIIFLSANFIYGLSDKSAIILLAVFGIYICFDGYFSALRTIRSSRVDIPEKKYPSKTSDVLEDFSKLAKIPAARSHMIKLIIFLAQSFIYFWLATKALKLILHAT